MRALFRRLAEYYGRHAIGIDLVLITAGAAAVKRRLENVHERLDALEQRGWVPLDDVMTVRDLAKVEDPLRRHEEALVDAGLLAPPEVAGEDPDADLVTEAPEAPQEAQGAN